MSVERSPKLFISYFIVCLSVIISTVYITINYWPQTNLGSIKKIRITHGETLSGISTMLKNNDIISNKWLFEFFTKMKGYDKSIQAGTFTFENVRTNDDIIDNDSNITTAQHTNISTSQRRNIATERHSNIAT